ncbi:uncharacterized protein LOC109850385 isoform X2 [Asparagus officinalis]|uniref:uncharacterized protein LOC109850385 isoform X2 n=1 Tax=Asparagus officinalis TaxID=4686 RepID=UPI00098E5916|nr:uncharacterized protein LOC109850385 isoform X2 [Asparagus officinalis]
MYNEWTTELKVMADRIISMRQQLFDALQTRATVGLILWPLTSTRGAREDEHFKQHTCLMEDCCVDVMMFMFARK